MHVLSVIIIIIIIIIIINFWLAFSSWIGKQNISLETLTLINIPFGVFNDNEDFRAIYGASDFMLAGQDSKNSVSKVSML